MARTFMLSNRKNSDPRAKPEAQQMEDTMRTLAAVATIATALLIGAAGPVQAAPWCAWFTGYSYNYDCSYFTFEQCLATIRGVGGYCARNVYPEPPRYPPPAHRKRPHPAYG
jgi:hypothetical protein